VALSAAWLQGASDAAALVIPMVVVLHPCEADGLRAPQAAAEDAPSPPGGRSAASSDGSDTTSADGTSHSGMGYMRVCAVLEKLMASYSQWGAPHVVGGTATTGSLPLERHCATPLFARDQLQ
jgi:hypothetical protein